MDRLAHVKQRNDGTWDRPPLEAHLLSVSSIAGEFAAQSSRPRNGGGWRASGTTSASISRNSRSTFVWCAITMRNGGSSGEPPPWDTVFMIRFHA